MEEVVPFWKWLINYEENVLCTVEISTIVFSDTSSYSSGLYNYHRSAMWVAMQ